MKPSELYRDAATALPGRDPLATELTPEQREAALFIADRAWRRHPCQLDPEADLRTCTHPDHTRDVEWARQQMEAAGLVPLVRERPAKGGISARPHRATLSGRCPECKRRKSLRTDGTLVAHRGPGDRPCHGEGGKPIEEAP